MTPYYQDDAVTIYHGDCTPNLPGGEARGCSADEVLRLAFGFTTVELRCRSCGSVRFVSSPGDQRGSVRFVSSPGDQRG